MIETLSAILAVVLLLWAAIGIVWAGLMIRWTRRQQQALEKRLSAETTRLCPKCGYDFVRGVQVLSARRRDRQ